jgi:hypothetical protein
MALLGYLCKKTSSQIDASPWGVQYLAREYPHDLLLDRMGGSGVKWARLSTSWRTVEFEKGRYGWDLLDRLVDGLIERGVDQILIGTGAGSHPAYHEFPAGYIYPPTDVPAALDGYCRYTAALVEHFSDRVRHYEIYNEPNWPLFWRPEPDPQAYGLLVQRAGEAMRGARTDVRPEIAGGSLAGVGPERTAYTHAFLSQPGAADALDILTYHPYNVVPETTFEHICALRDLVGELKPGMRIWQGECGCPSSGDTIHARLDAPWGYRVQAKWLLRRLLTDYLAGAEVSIYFLISEFHGNLHPGSPELRTGYNTKGLVQHTTWETKPAYYALQNLAATIDASWTRVEDEVRIDVVDPGIFYGIGPHEDRFPCLPWQLAMRRDETPLLAYWLPWRPQEIVQPATVRFTWPGVRWNAPVCVDLLSGAVSEARTVNGELEVPLADYPLLVTEDAALELADEPQQPAYDEIVSKLRWTY